MKKKKSFWNMNLNPITMWKKPKSKELKNHSIEVEIRKPDQQSIFKPKGFR